MRDRTGSPARLSPCRRVSSAKSGSHRVFAGSSPITASSFASETYQKSGSFPPPALPGFRGTTTLSDARQDRMPCSTVEAATLIPRTGLPRLRNPCLDVLCPLPRWTVPVRLSAASRSMRPSPVSGRVGVHNFPFGACSGFTHVTARRVAQPPEAAFVAGLRYGQSPNRTACQLPGQPTIARVGLAPTR